MPFGDFVEKRRNQIDDYFFKDGVVHGGLATMVKSLQLPA
jgi:hypothetical protein